MAGARLWVIDNDPTICEGMRTLLQGWGCRVLTAVSLADLAAQVTLEREPVDLILADYHLDHEETGVDAVAAINQCRRQPVPVVMITANYSNELKHDIRERGYLLMNKPVKPLKLRTTLHHLLGA